MSTINIDSDTDFSADQYRQPWESDEHWELRKTFIEEYKDLFPEDRLVCLSQVYYNVEILGCTYPAAVMKQFAKLKEGLSTSKPKKGKKPKDRSVAQETTFNQLKQTVNEYRISKREPSTKKPKLETTSTSNRKTAASFFSAEKNVSDFSISAQSLARKKQKRQLKSIRLATRLSLPHWIKLNHFLKMFKSQVKTPSKLLDLITSKCALNISWEFHGKKPSVICKILLNKRPVVKGYSDTHLTAKKLAVRKLFKIVLKYESYILNKTQNLNADTLQLLKSYILSKNKNTPTTPALDQNEEKKKDSSLTSDAPIAKPTDGLKEDCNLDTNSQSSDDVIILSPPRDIKTEDKLLESPPRNTIVAPIESPPRNSITASEARSYVDIRTPLSPSNIGKKIMSLMGWTGGGLGKYADGILEPILPVTFPERQGVGSTPIDPYKMYENAISEKKVKKKALKKKQRKNDIEKCEEEYSTEIKQKQMTTDQKEFLKELISCLFGSTPEENSSLNWKKLECAYRYCSRLTDNPLDCLNMMAGSCRLKIAWYNPAYFSSRLVINGCAVFGGIGVDLDSSRQMACRNFFDTILTRNEKISPPVHKMSGYYTVCCKLTNEQRESLRYNPFKMILYDDLNEDPMSILSTSAALNNMSMIYECNDENDCSSVILEDRVVSSVSLDVKEAEYLRKEAARHALRELQKTCHTIKLQSSLITGRELTPSNIFVGNVAPNARLPASNIGNKLMSRIGWNKSEIAKSGVGIVDPTNRQCVGGKKSTEMSDKVFRSAIIKILQEYFTSDDQDDLVFSSDFSKEQRKIVHLAACGMQLWNKSYGSGTNRYLVVKKHLVLEKVLCNLIKCGGETKKYKLIAPYKLF